MYIESLELKNFRNYEELSIVLDPGTNILYGDNAQGKTNVLEAVYLCGTTKSHRGSKDKEMIRFEQDESHIRMMVKKDGVSHKIDMHLKKNKAKGIAIDGIPIRKAAETRIEGRRMRQADSVPQRSDRAKRGIRYAKKCRKHAQRTSQQGILLRLSVSELCKLFC